MNKVLSRMLMLGALVGCLATAAWAGNVEVDMVGDGAILYPALRMAIMRPILPL